MSGSKFLLHVNYCDPLTCLSRPPGFETLLYRFILQNKSKTPHKEVCIVQVGLENLTTEPVTQEFQPLFTRDHTICLYPKNTPNNIVYLFGRKRSPYVCKQQPETGVQKKIECGV